MSPPYFEFSEIKDLVQREEKREYIEDYLYSRLGDLTDMERTRKMILMAFASMCFHYKYLNDNFASLESFQNINHLEGSPAIGQVAF